MRALLLCLFFWLITTWLETVLFSSSSWFQPNLFFLIPIIFCLQWRSAETHFIFLFFGLTADSFSTLPFGIFGLSFFILSFFIRQQAVRAHQESFISGMHTALIATFSTLLLNILVLLILLALFSETTLSWEWLSRILLNEIIPTALLSVPLRQLMNKIEQKYPVKVGER